MAKVLLFLIGKRKEWNIQWVFSFTILELKRFMKMLSIIIVTHHALTMSKMNRLYGVTMPQKGISQLVAVDLQKAESMVA